ncbi:FHA domain-containing protein [Actinomycetes bacterium KLBMP 9797]
MNQPVASRAGAALASLVVLGPPHLRGQELQVTPGRAVIGRDDGATLTLADDRVSRQHAAVWTADGAAWIVDLGSRNGTLVNRARLGGTPQRLVHGDHIDIGGVTLAFHEAPRGVRYTFAGGQSAGQINNVGRDYNLATHNRYDVDINPLPRSRAGRTLIILGVTLQFVGMIPFGYWVLAFMAEIFAVLGDPSADPSDVDLPPFLPWVPLGVVLTVIGSAMWMYGAVIAFSTRRRQP